MDARIRKILAVTTGFVIVIISDTILGLSFLVAVLYSGTLKNNYGVSFIDHHKFLIFIGLWSVIILEIYSLNFILRKVRNYAEGK